MLDSTILRRAIVIDFESFQVGPPLLCGTLIDGEFKLTVLHERLRQAANAKNLPLRSAVNFVGALVDRANTENRHFIAFSTKELTDIEGLLGIDVSEQYVNALTLAKNWRKMCHPAEHRRVNDKRRRMREQNQYVGGYGNRFTDFARLAGLEIPRDYGQSREAYRIRRVINQLKLRGVYERLTRVTKAQWTKALKHNRFDVEGLAALCRRISFDGTIN